MAILLEDSDSVTWVLGVGTDGLLTTTAAPGIARALFINRGGQSWMVGVEPSGLLTTTSVTFSPYRIQFLILTDALDQNWTLSITDDGLLQTSFGGDIFWQPNGYGAGTDNSVVGGAGGYMAYPQPPPSGEFTTPETDALCGPLFITFNNNQGNAFSIQNPGSNG